MLRDAETLPTSRMNERFIWSKITRFTRFTGSLSYSNENTDVKNILSRTGQIHLSLQLFEGGCEKIWTNIFKKQREFMSRYFFWHSLKKRPSCLFPPGVATPSCLSKTSFQPRVLTRHHLEEERSVQLQVASGVLVCSMDQRGAGLCSEKNEYALEN